jgi:hypothetical protein
MVQRNCWKGAARAVVRKSDSLRVTPPWSQYAVSSLLHFFGIGGFFTTLYS